MRTVREFLDSLDPRARSWHPQFIQDLARKTGTKNYLEVGVYRGETLRKVARVAETSTAIDIDREALRSISNLRRTQAFLGTLQDYVVENPERLFDLIFIDANHEQSAVFDDFKSATGVCSTDGIILLHDTWPKSPEFASQQYCGDAYMAVNRIRSEFPDWQCVTIPVHPGLTICQRKDSSPSSNWG